MTDSKDAIEHTGQSRAPARVLAALPAFLLSLGASAICYCETNVTLGLFLGPLILTTLIVPALILAEQQWRLRLFVLIGVTVGPAIVWLSVPREHLFDVQQVVLCMWVLLAWLSAVSAIAISLRKFRVEPSLASSLTVITALFWLTWPIWLSPLLASHQRAVSWLCWAHPVMAMNWGVSQLGLWGSPMGGSDFAYRYLTILNQDVGYPHSESIWPCVLVDGLFAVCLQCVMSLADKISNRQISNG